MKEAANRKREAVKAGLAKLDRALRAQPIVAKAAKSKIRRGELSELPEGQCFAVKQLMAILKLNRQQIRDLCETGELQGAVDLRSRGSCRATIRVPRAAVIAFLEARQTIAAAEKRPTKRPRIAPTKPRRHYDPAAALMQWLQ